ATNTAAPTATNTAAPTATGTPTTQCLTFGQKIQLLVGILLRFGSHEGDRRYRAEYDVDRDGRIDFDDLKQVLETPTCPRHHHE
ncbi:MAG: hypothetical protein IVW36_11940, partial [Dehalococcoidia bacterium]|nr:hypothetical protein [Dehalococcoidia bacterium]